MKVFYFLFLLLFLNVYIVQAEDDFLKGSLEDILSMESEMSADIGSRNGAKSLLDSSAPIDVITYEQIEHSGLTSLTNVLQYFVAGFNAPNPSVSDGSDHVRAFTLRGMSPDQTLVLVNGKRVHTAALLHVNGAIGRGASNVDLDTIAIRSIEKIEILRDGAAAQYGSDAISGVINIILKGIGHKDSMSIHTGKRKAGDGTQLSADAFFSTPLKYDGFINVTLQAKKEEQTNRAGLDSRITPQEVKTHYGLPDSHNFLAVVNIEVPQEDNTNIYANSIINYRDSESSAFFRTPDVNRSIYPNGFLPIINAEILDYSLTAGVKGEFGDGVYWDLSNVYGYNQMDFSLHDTMNYALGAASPTSFDNGSLSFLQNTTNFDLKKNLGQLNLAFGLEYRYENYQIKAGEEASYFDGGSQGFSGFRPENETDSSRNSYALYVDATYNFTSGISLESALRYEKFSDFGDTTNVKLALTYKILDDLLLRTSASTGFRAPSLSQSHFSHTSSFLTAGVFVAQGTLKPSHEVSQLFGAEELKAEKSKHFGLGGVYQPTQNLSFLVDYFYIRVDDRIMLSKTFNLSAADQITHGMDQVSFLTNAVNTQTQGIDVKLNYEHPLEGSAKLSTGLWYSYNKNEVIGFNTTGTTRENSLRQIDRIENGQPKESIRILTNYETNNYNIAFNLSRYGTFNQVTSDKVYDFDAIIMADLDITYNISKEFKISLGGNNIFDATPSKWKDLSGAGYGSAGILPYSNYSPAGYSGAYYYMKATIEF